jgi:predicted MPP superfamily phosphohydrolase
VALALFGLYVLFYGTFVGAEELEVNRVEISFDDLPEGFDGYRIVQFSDAHVGTYTGARQSYLERVVDSINAQKGNIIVFTGDLQNQQPEEIEAHMPLLKKLKAEDGLVAVLGNHDYADYLDCDDYTKVINLQRTAGLEEDMGWTVLINGRRFIRHNGDSIVIAGMDNDGERRFPANGDINRTLWGIRRSHFVVMLEHDPTSWRRKILPHCHAQLTLSGHTHGGQCWLFGWSPASLVYRECAGLYELGHRYLYVSKGVGGCIPFRFGATGEITVITLKRK